MPNQNFSDLRGRTWTVEVTVATVASARKRLDLDLMRVVEDKSLIEELARDPVKLVDLLYVACEEQCLAADVSDVEFGRSMGGDALDQGYDALMEAILDFFPNPRKREILRDLWTRTKKVEQAAVERMAAKLADPKVDRWIESEMDKIGRLPPELGV